MKAQGIHRLNPLSVIQDFKHYHNSSYLIDCDSC